MKERKNDGKKEGRKSKKEANRCKRAAHWEIKLKDCEKSDYQKLPKKSRKISQIKIDNIE